MTDRIFATAGGWAVGADELQWMLMRRIRRKRGDCWDPVSFVHSTRDVLARCMREKGVEPGTAAQLLSGLPETFDQWKRTSPPARSVQVDHPSDPADLSDPADVMDALMGPAALLGGPIGPIARIGPTGPAA